MGLIDKILGRKPEEPPKGESPVIPAHGPALPDGSLTFPDGIRTAIVDVDGVQWELINHTEAKLITFRLLDDRDATKGPVFQLDESTIGEAVLEVGTLLHPKKLEQIRKGAWLDGLHPGTYFAVVDQNGAKDERTGQYTDTYTLPYGDLIRFLLSKVAATGSKPEGFADVSEARAADGQTDGGRVGAEPAGRNAGAGEAAGSSGAQDQASGQH